MPLGIQQNKPTCEYKNCGQSITHTIEWFKPGTQEVAVTVYVCEDDFRRAMRTEWLRPTE